MIKAKVIKTEWIKTPLIKFSYLFPDKQLRILYRFVLDSDIYEKEDDDIHFAFKRFGPKPIPNKNDEINVFVPKSKNPNKVTFNESSNTIKPIIGFAFLAILSFGITSLIIYNWK
ncbi:hypothetical protein [Aquimarina intermedia]|nr:hypothetical protein [Aquimarina intermedia]